MDIIISLSLEENLSPLLGLAETRPTLVSDQKNQVCLL